MSLCEQSIFLLLFIESIYNRSRSSAIFSAFYGTDHDTLNKISLEYGVYQNDRYDYDYCYRHPDAGRRLATAAAMEALLLVLARPASELA